MNSIFLTNVVGLVEGWKDGWLEIEGASDMLGLVDRLGFIDGRSVGCEDIDGLKDMDGCSEGCSEGPHIRQHSHSHIMSATAERLNLI